jgi:hypothetical protein
MRYILCRVNTVTRLDEAKLADSLIILVLEPSQRFSQSRFSKLASRFQPTARVESLVFWLLR